MDDFLKSLEEDNPAIQQNDKLSCSGCVHIVKRYPFVRATPCCYCIRAHQEDFYEEETK